MGRKPTKKDPSQQTPPTKGPCGDLDVSPGEKTGTWDKVDEANWESFPASDPPSWSPAQPRSIVPPHKRPAAERR